MNTEPESGEHEARPTLRGIRLDTAVAMEEDIRTLPKPEPAMAPEESNYAEWYEQYGWRDNQ